MTENGYRQKNAPGHRKCNGTTMPVFEFIPHACMNGKTFLFVIYAYCVMDINALPRSSVHKTLRCQPQFVIQIFGMPSYGVRFRGKCKGFFYSGNRISICKCVPVTVNFLQHRKLKNQNSENIWLRKGCGR